MSSAIFMAASADLRLSASRMRWHAQQATGAKLGHATDGLRVNLVRAHPVMPAMGHGSDAIWL